MGLEYMMPFLLHCPVCDAPADKIEDDDGEYPMLLKQKCHRCQSSWKVYMTFRSGFPRIFKIRVKDRLNGIEKGKLRKWNNQFQGKDK